MRASELGAFLAFANRLADTSRSIIDATLREGWHFETKADRSPVTEIDRQVECTLREAIAATYPDQGILGEEFGPSKIDAEFVWVLDPIDGTRAFVTGLPTFGTLIALAHRGVPVLGIIDLPMTRKRWVGAESQPATLNGVPVRVRDCGRLAEALICTSSPDYYSAEELSAFGTVRAAANWCVYGGGCNAYGSLASGAIDVGIETAHDPIDYCALAAVIRSAGGIITDWEGNPLTIHSGRRYLAAGSPAVHAEVLEILARCGAGAG